MSLQALNLYLLKLDNFIFWQIQSAKHYLFKLQINLMHFIKTQKSKKKSTVNLSQSSSFKYMPKKPIILLQKDNIKSHPSDFIYSQKNLLSSKNLSNSKSSKCCQPRTFFYSPAKQSKNKEKGYQNNELTSHRIKAQAYKFDIQKSIKQNSTFFTNRNQYQISAAQKFQNDTLQLSQQFNNNKKEKFQFVKKKKKQQDSSFNQQLTYINYNEINKQYLNLRQQDNNFIANKFKLKKAQSEQLMENSTRLRLICSDNFASDIELNHTIIKQNKTFKCDDFIRIKDIGVGKYGRVYLARQVNTGFICALKIIRKQILKQQGIIEQFIRQVKIQQYLNHPHLVKQYGCFDDEYNIYIILQVLIDGHIKSLLQKKKIFSEERAATYLYQVCQAVQQLHCQNIIHRDIKLQNIVIHQNVLKLCDFGWSVYQNNGMRTTFCGTPLYVCPEILVGKQYNSKVDVWSLGIILYEMIFGKPPFQITKEAQMQKIIKDQIVYPKNHKNSKEVINFIDQCLNKNPSKRPSIQTLLSHSFFQKFPYIFTLKNQLLKQI